MTRPSPSLAYERRSGHHPEEHQESLWWLTLAPGVWAAHFLASYLTAAIWCAKAAGPAAPLGGVRTAILAYTALALAVIAATGRHGWRRHRLNRRPPPHDVDSPGDRHRFLGFATLLLAGVSFVAVLYVTLVVIFFESCR